MPKLSEFSRNALVMMTGSVAAQAIGILSSPILTRLYRPEDFGVYALFLSITAMLGVFACGRYELGITLPRDDRDGFALVKLCCLIALGLSLLLIPIGLVFQDALIAALDEPRLRRWIWLLPLATLLTALVAAARYWFVRTKSFRFVSSAGVVRTLSAALANIALGVWGAIEYGLIAGYLIGLALNAAMFAWIIWDHNRPQIAEANWSVMATQARIHSRLPKLSTGSALVESGASQVPIFFFSSLFGATTLGLFSFSQRIATLPITLIAGSMSDVFRQRASELYAQQGHCDRFFLATMRKLSLISIPGFALLAAIAPWLFATVFGPEWEQSGSFVRLLTPTLALRFIASPLSSMFFIANEQARDLFIQAVLLVTLLATFSAVGYFRLDATSAVGIYAVIYCIKYTIELVLSYRFSKGKAAT